MIHAVRASRVHVHVSHQHGRRGGLEKAGHVLDGQHVDAELSELPREVQVVLEVVLLAAGEAST